MYHSLKLLLISLLTFNLIHAEETFVNTSKLNLSYITHSYKYCKSTQLKRQLCKEKKLTYLDYNDTQLPSFLNTLKSQIQPTLTAYKNILIKTSTLQDIKDLPDISGEWYTELNMDLFAKTPQTYTLMYTSSGYDGGAHGYYGVGLDNYDIKTKQKLTLSDLFLEDYNQTLHTLAEAHYKNIHSLKPNQTLDDDGWFVDKFVLAKNFAITQRGLLFIYNQYEIKPYVAGLTEFLLPYSKIHQLIDPKGALAFTLQEKYTLLATFTTQDTMSITFEAIVNKDKSVTITTHMHNHTYTPKAWLSLSFPQIQNKDAIIHKSHKGFKQLHAYSKGSKVYHKKQKKAIKSSYLLIEAEQNQWNENTPHSITVRLTPPHNSKELVIDVRALLKSQDDVKTLPNDYEGVTGQQGYKNYRVFMKL